MPTEDEELRALLARVERRVARDQDRPTSSFVGDVLLRQGLGQGLAFGFGDEIAAGARSLFPGQTYDAALADERGKLAAAERERPVASTAAQLGGAILPSIAALLATPATGGASAAAGAANLARVGGTAARILTGAGRGAAMGAVQGGVQGFGEGEGGFASRVDHAVLPALIGGGVGGAIGGAIPAAGRAIEHWRTTPQQRAQDVLLGQMADEGTTPRSVYDAYAQRQAAHGAKPETVADIMPNSNLAGALDEATTRPAEGRASLIGAIMQRMDTQGTRVLDDFQAIFGDRARFQPTMRALEEARTTQSRPLYAAVDRFGPVADNDVNRLLLAMPDDVFNAAERAAQWEGRRLEPLVRRENGVAGLTRTPTASELDYVKRGLSDVIERGTDIAGRMNSDAYRAFRAQQQLLARMDDIVVDGNGRRVYAEARDAWAGPSAQRDAMQHGRRVLREDADVTIERIDAMGRAEREAFLIGFMDAVRGRLGSVNQGNNAARTLGMSPNSLGAIQAAMHAITDDPAEAIRLTQALRGNIEREMQIARSNNRMFNNSQTATRQAFREGARADPGVIGGLAADVATGGIPVGTMASSALGAFRSAAKDIAGRRSGASDRALAGESLRLLGGMDERSVYNAMAELERRRRQALAAQYQQVGPMFGWQSLGAAGAGGGVAGLLD